MKKFNLIIVATCLLLTSCDYNGKNFPDYGYRPTDVKTLDYTLTDADYKTIADSKANQAIAEADGELAEFKALTTTKAFSITLSAQKYIPALLASLYPTADTKSAVRVTYNYRAGTSTFYKLSNYDYLDIWGNASNVGALTPSKPPEQALTLFLAMNFDNALEGDVKIIEYQYLETEDGEQETRFAYAKFETGSWALNSAKIIYILTEDDYSAMGKTALSAADAPNYLPILLQLKYPFAQNGDVKVIVYKTPSAANTANEYIYENGVWSPVSFIEKRTEQFIKVAGGKWVFDPTVHHTMVKADYQLMVDYVLNHPVLYVYNRIGAQGTPYLNEEWYYGFNAYYDNVSLRVSGSVSSSRDVPCSREYDTELHSLATDEEKYEFLWKRLCEEGMIIYLQLKFPDAVAISNGVPVEYHITAKVYYGPTANDAKFYVFLYKTLTSGTNETPPTFEFLDVVEQ